MAPLQGKGGTAGGKGGGRSEKSLRQSIKKRTNCLCKKAYELATLCDVEVALVCYPLDGAEPTIWPPDRSKIEDAIFHYLDTPAHKKLPKNQITLYNPNPGDGNDKDAGISAAAAAAAKDEEKVDRLRIPFPDDEEKLIALGRILDSRLEAVRKLIAVRRKEGRRDPRLSAPDPGNKLDRDQGEPTPAVAAVSGGFGELRASDQDRGKRVALDYRPDF